MKYMLKVLAGLLAMSLSVPAPASERQITIVAVGDSLVAGYGLSQEDGFTGQLERTLKRLGHNVIVENAGKSGATSEWGLKWLQEAAVTGDHAVILELGVNDWGKVRIEDTQANLERIVAQLAARNIPVLLVGVEQSPASSADYRAVYDRIVPELAKKHDQQLYPSFLRGVAGQKELHLDRVHPNREGTKVIIDNMLPSVQTLIGRVGKP